MRVVLLDGPAGRGACTHRCAYPDALVTATPHAKTLSPFPGCPTFWGHCNIITDEVVNRFMRGVQEMLWRHEVTLRYFV